MQWRDESRSECNNGANRLWENHVSILFLIQLYTDDVTIQFTNGTTGTSGNEMHCIKMRYTAHNYSYVHA